MTTENKFNSKDFQSPEFTIEVDTSMGRYTLEAFNVGKGFVLEHPMITPVLGKSTKDLPNMIEKCTSQLESALDTMT